MKKVIAAVLVLVAFGGGISWLSNNYQKKEQNLKMVKAGYQQDEYISKALIKIAEEKGFFRAKGVKIEKVPIQTKLNAALVAGDFDVLMASSAGSLATFYGDKDIIFVNKLETRPPLIGSVYKEGKPEEFNKAAVATLGGVEQTYIEIVKNNLGIKNKIEYSSAAIGTPMITAISQGTVDLAVMNVYNDNLAKLIEKNQLKVIEPTELWKNKIVPGGVATTRKALNTKREALRGFVLAINQAEEYAQKHQREFKQLLISEYELSDGVASKITEMFLATLPETHTSSEADFADLKEALKNSELKNLNRPLSEFIENKLLVN